MTERGQEEEGSLTASGYSSLLLTVAHTQRTNLIHIGRWVEWARQDKEDDKLVRWHRLTIYLQQFCSNFVVPNLQFQNKYLLPLQQVVNNKVCYPSSLDDWCVCVCVWKWCAIYTALSNLQNRAGTAHAALIASKQGKLQSKLQKKSKKKRKNPKGQKRITILYRKSYIYKKQNETTKKSDTV